MGRPSKLEYDENKVDDIFNMALQEMQGNISGFKPNEFEYMVDDMLSLTKKDFMSKYGMSSAEYDKLRDMVEEMEESEDEEPEEGGEDHDSMLALMMMWMGLSTVYYMRDVERDTELTIYEDVGGEDLYLNWVTMGDDLVCEECLEYEAGSPYPVDLFPHIPHPFCRCQPEPCDADGNPVDLSRANEVDLEEYMNIVEEFQDIGIDFEVVVPPTEFNPIIW